MLSGSPQTTTKTNEESRGDKRLASGDSYLSPSEKMSLPLSDTVFVDAVQLYEEAVKAQLGDREYTLLSRLFKFLIMIILFAVPLALLSQPPCSL